MDDFYFLCGEVANLDSQEKLHESGAIAIKIEIAKYTAGYIIGKQRKTFAPKYLRS